MLVYAPAKVNLYLEIKGVDRSGYHILETVFQEISLRDELVIEKKKESGVKISVLPRNARIGPVKKNIIVKAYNLICEAAGKNPGVAVKLTKKIPSGAGLGGGSSDAAAFINAFDKLYRLKLTKKTKLDIASSTGADTAFFLNGGCSIGLGRGSILKPVKSNSKLWFVLVYPKFKVSTKKAYNLYDKYNKPALVDGLLTTAKNINNIKRYLKTNKSVLLKNILKNDFEGVVAQSYPGIKGLLEFLRRRSNALYCGLSGSGSVCFAMYNKKDEAVRFFNRLKNNSLGSVYLAQGVNRAAKRVLKA